LLAPIAAALLQLALSRSREYDADRAGAALLADGTALARALAKIDSAARRTPMHVEPAQAGKYLINPLAGHTVALASLFSTHPPTEARIARLLGTSTRRYLSEGVSTLGAGTDTEHPLWDRPPTTHEQ
jgi:heat shock protein HtpX